jgi:nudix-type nucleoside diphosphatase (YffH/AdpP family)
MDDEPRKHTVHSRKRLLDDFFKVDELVISHQKADHSWSEQKRTLIFERGDAAAVLLYNSDTDHVVLVRQFRAPTLDKGLGGQIGPGDGWIVEAIAGMIPDNEKPEKTAVRETQEETGYVISEDDLTSVATYFASPGGATERIFLYFAEVKGPDRSQTDGGVGAEDTEIIHVSSKEVFDWLDDNQIEDSKLAIGAGWLRERLTKKKAARQRQHSEPLTSKTVEYGMESNSSLIIGYKTGSIENVKGVDIWVNSENEDMIMDRFTGRSISATIRWLGAEKDVDDNATEDTIANALTRALQHVQHVKIGTIVETTAGELERNGVKRLYHVASVRGEGPGRGFRAELPDLGRCVRNVLQRVDRKNRHPWTRLRSTVSQRSIKRSVLFPMIGAGAGGLELDDVAAELIRAAFDFFQQHDDTEVRQVYFLAFTKRHKDACEKALASFGGLLKRLP